MNLTLESTSDPVGVSVVDHIQRRRCRLATDSPPAVTRLDPELAPFTFPVTVAARLEAGTVRLNGSAVTYVRTDSGDIAEELYPGERSTFSEAGYEIDLNAPVKLYLRPESAFELQVGTDTVSVTVHDERILLGARSYHTRPAAVVRTTGQPADVMRALSTFGSALKTTTPEQSYPTLRGHPPRLELGDELDLPAELSAPDTGIQIELPRKLGSVFAAASPAFYLGADVVPSEPARVRTDDGFVHDLDTARGIEGELAYLLRAMLVADCIVRTEGYYQFPVDGMERILSHLETDLEDLYDASLARRLETALSLPADAVESIAPSWGVVADVVPEPAGIDALAFLADRLAAIRPARPEPLSPADVRRRALSTYLEEGRRVDREGDDSGNDGDGKNAGGEDADGETVTERATREGSGNAPFVSVDARGPDVVDHVSVERIYVGDGVPIDAGKGLVSGFENGLALEESDESVSVLVVGTDSLGESEPDLVESVYGSGRDLPFSIQVRWIRGRSDLRDALETNVDFLHFVGHVDEDGFRCPDGALDAASLDAVGATAFLLNACRSYEQGQRLVEAGSAAGVVTFSEVIDEEAVAVGEAMARLLNLGFPIGAAMRVSRSTSVVGGQYTVIGDSTVDLVQDEHGMPMLLRVLDRDDDRWRVRVETFLPKEGGMGSLAYPFLDGGDRRYLAPGPVDTVSVSPADLEQFFGQYSPPVLLDGSLLRREELVEMLEPDS